MEVRRHRQTVVEVVRVDQSAGAADVEHDGNAGVGRGRPDGVEGDVAWRVGWRATRSNQQRGRTQSDRLAGQFAGALEIGQWDVQRGQQARIGGTELDHRPVVGPGRADRQLHVAGVLPRAQPRVVERVEDQLAGEAEHVERPAAVLGDEAAGGGEVLAVHDFGRFGIDVLVGVMAGGETAERVVDVAKLFDGVARLAQFIDRRIRQRREPISKLGIGVVAQPVGRLHDVGIGVVDDEPGGVVWHHISVASATTTGIG